MSFNLVEDLTDVGFVRNMLVQAGRFATNVRDNDLYYIFQGQTGAVVYTDHQDLIDVAREQQYIQHREKLNYFRPYHQMLKRFL